MKRVFIALILVSILLSASVARADVWGFPAEVTEVQIDDQHSLFRVRDTELGNVCYVLSGPPTIAAISCVLPAETMPVPNLP